MSAENEGRRPENKPFNPWRTRTDSLEHYADALHPPMPDRNNPLLHKKKNPLKNDKSFDFNQPTRPAVRTYERYARYLGEVIESFEDAPPAPPFDGYYATGLDPEPQRKMQAPIHSNDYNLNEEEEELELENMDTVNLPQNENTTETRSSITEVDWDNLPSRERTSKAREVQILSPNQELPHDLCTKAFKQNLKQVKNETQNVIEEENINSSPRPWG